MKNLVLFLICLSTSIQLLAQHATNVSSGSAGWKRIAYVNGDNGRGFGKVSLYSTGGSFRPTTLTIDWYHDWSSGGGVSVSSNSIVSPYWDGVRITDDGVNAYIEVNFLTKVTGLGVLSDSHGWRTATPYPNILPDGGGDVRASASAGRFNVQNHFTVAHNGNVGIGTASPQAKLAVNGNILAKEVKVKNDISVPDYVFEPDYKLPSLAETEAYIKVHKHLPEIPSAADIKQDGLDLAEMNLLLLKKVEELTLHLIEKDKEIARQSKALKDQRELVELYHREFETYKQQKL